MNAPLAHLLTGLGAVTLASVVLWIFAAALGALRQRSRLPVEGRWIAVTGCDSGFGLGVVRSLVARGARVIACCYTQEGADRALSEGAALAPRADLTNEDELRALAHTVLSTSGGRLWGLVHNAGTVLPGFVDYLPLSFYRRVMELNFFAAVHLTQRLLPALRSAGGRVVVVSSVDGLVSLPGNAPYDASKFAVEAYADALRVELSFSGVGVSVVNPSTMRTPLAMGFFQAHRTAWDAMDEQDPGGPWQQLWPRPWLEDYIATNTANLERIAQDPAVTVAHIDHALTARHPRHRYLSGTLAQTLFRALWWAPESWSYRVKRALVQPLPPPQDLRGAAGVRP